MFNLAKINTEKYKRFVFFLLLGVHYTRCNQLYYFCMTYLIGDMSNKYKLFCILSYVMKALFIYESSRSLL